MNNSRIDVANKTIIKIFKDLEIYDYLSDDTVTEIMINTDRKIWIKKLGEGFIDTNKLADNNKTMNILKILATLNELSLNEENPRLSAELIYKLTDDEKYKKARLEGLIPPVVANPKFNIRKKIPVTKRLEDYLKDKFITQEQYDYFIQAVKDKKNILIVGGTDTGKTTFANALLGIMDILNERLIIVEEVEELQTKAQNVDRITITEGVFSSTEALKSCMRLSPERIIFGEVRGAESYDLLGAFNSGHSGGLSTIHANDGQGGLKKLEMYNQLACQKPMSEFIVLGINILITLKMENYKRYLDEIVELEGYNSTTHMYELKTIYKRN